MTLACVSLIVRDYDEAIAYFTQILQFSLLEDTVLSESKRWVRVTPPRANCTQRLLAKAATPKQQVCIGNQTGGRVGFFLQTDDFAQDYAAKASRGVKFLEPPREETYGTVVVFEDLYGNRWDLVQPKGSSNNL